MFMHYRGAEERTPQKPTRTIFIAGATPWVVAPVFVRNERSQPRSARSGNPYRRFRPRLASLRLFP